MSSAAGSPVGEGSSQLPTVPKKRGRKEGTTSKAKGKGKAAAAREGGDGDSEQQQQSQRGVTPQQQSSQPSGSASRDDTMQGGAGSRSGQPAAAGASDSSRPAKKERTEKRGGQKLSRKNLFAKDLPEMMYACGDDPNPLPESVNVLEEIIVDYLSELCKTAAVHSPNAKKIRLDDLRFALRKPQQGKQLARVEELLYLQEDIARARKNLDISYGKNAPPGY